MIPVTAEQMQQIDQRARLEYGIDQSYLMERAGFAVSEAVIEGIRIHGASKILVFCGKGNNGGDGFVAARHLKDKVDVDLCVYSPENCDIRKGAALKNFKEAVRSGIKIKKIELFSSYHKNIPPGAVVIDALLGTGFSGHMSGVFGSIARKVNLSGASVYSVDVPSGLNATTGEAPGDCFKAAQTITFGLPKTGFYRNKGPEFCGRLVIADIGFPEELLREFKKTL